MKSKIIPWTAVLMSGVIPLLFYIIPGIGITEISVPALQARHAQNSTEMTVEYVSSEKLKSQPNFKATGFASQLFVFISAFIIKPLYMTLSLIFAFFLYRYRDDRLNSLCAAMIAFYVGELFCFLNYLLFDESSVITELGHMYGMTLAFGLTVYWATSLLQRTALGAASGANCIFKRVCDVCTADTKQKCRIAWLYPPVIATFSAVAVIILMSGYNLTAYVTEILETAYHYGHAIAFQVYEIRISPIIALVMFGISLTLYFRNIARYREVIDFFVSLGIGHVGFSLLRKGLVALFPDLVWFVIWEELTEMLYILLLMYICYLYFPGLFRLRKKAPMQ